MTIGIAKSHRHVFLPGRSVQHTRKANPNPINVVEIVTDNTIPIVFHINNGTSAECSLLQELPNTCKALKTMHPMGKVEITVPVAVSVNAAIFAIKNRVFLLLLVNPRSNC